VVNPAFQVLLSVHSRLTLAQMQQYITDNNLPNKSNDTLTTGDIYDYVVEGLSAGAATVVIVEPGTVIEIVLATTPLASPVLSACSPSVSFVPPSLYFVNGVKCLLSNQKETPICLISK
jgi:hypothetical protein